MILTTKNCPAGNRQPKTPAINLCPKKGTLRFNACAARLLDFDTSGNLLSFEIKNKNLYLFWDLSDGFNVKYCQGTRTYSLYNVALARTIWESFREPDDNASLRFEIGDFHEGKYQLVKRDHQPFPNAVQLK